ncbi:MAG: transglutaminase domain-containing protein [Lachnospiraceae bacterium]|nr:transglutaminase domain-containing protein [Lachnospiraceae bacterium]
MHIFGRKKKIEFPELTLVQVQESRKYNFFAALAKALLLFMLIYGAIGGFLSSLELKYNNGMCMLVLFGLALLLAAVYETEMRWLTNIVSIMVFIFYLYIAVANYWAINNGYYAILNRVYEVARDYLDVGSGMEYALIIEETYATVTMFVLFLGMVGVILMNIMLQNKCSLVKVAFLTLPPYVVPFYFDCSPDLIYILFLLIGYLAVAMLQGGNVREKLSGQMCYILPLAAVLTILIVRTLAFIMPETGYGRAVPKSVAKETSEAGMARFAQYGLTAMLRQGSANAGVSGGRLGNSSVVPTYETVLKVRYTPYDYNPVYLKAFTGKDYLGDMWSKADTDLPDDDIMLTTVENRMRHPEDVQGQGTMIVEKLERTDRFQYRPYYTAAVVPEEPVKNACTYVYYPDVCRTGEVTGEPSDVYLDVPQSCLDAVAKVCEEAGFAGTEEEIAEQIVRYFDDNYSYTLRPGYAFGNPDYISHFLLNSKRGYCAHFASAATMLFRQMGVHARYAEGYAFSYLNVVESGELVEGAEYSDYYKGYSPIGETALIEIEIPDAYAHAWVEIYVDGQGWIVVDPTPAQTSEEETTSFWNAFMTGSGGDTDLEMSESNLGAYLEGTLGGVSYVLLGAAALVLIGLWTVHLVRAFRESKLPGRERVRLEYGRIQSYLGKKHLDYRKLRTLREQIDWVRTHSRLEIDGAQEEALYQVYFAENVDCDCDELCRQLRKMKKALRFSPMRAERR